MHLVAWVGPLLAVACGARSDLGTPEPRANPLDAARDVVQDVIDDEGQVTEAGVVDALPDVVVAQFPRTRIVVNRGTVCALNAADGVECWGSNGAGDQIGNGSSEPMFNTPQQVTGLTSGVVSLGGDGESTCAIGETGAVSCWGTNDNGALGDGTFTSGASTPASVTGITTGVAASGNNGGGPPWGVSMCVLLSSGDVTCMGSNQYGGLALGTISSSNFDTPQPSTVTDAVALSVAGVSGSGPTCAVLDNGTVQCWGSMLYSLGDGSTTVSGVPISVAGIESAVQVAATGTNICIVLADGTMKCWGYDYLGAVGDGNAGSNTNSTTPVTSTLSDVAFVSVSQGQNTCAVTRAGAVECVGANWDGQLGYLTSDDYSPYWHAAITSGAVQVACGEDSTCALMANGTVYCWGDNSYGEVGDGTYIQRDTPVLVKGF